MSDRLNENRIKKAMSWLKYDECFLDKADQKSVPAFERLNYIGKFSSNLNRFLSENSDVLNEFIIKSYIKNLYKKRDEKFNSVSKELEAVGIVHQRLRDASEGLKSYIHNLFYGKISPELDTKILDSNSNLNYIKDNTTYIATAFSANSSGKQKYLVAEIPGSGEIVYTRTNGIEYILMEDIVLAHVSSLVIPYEVEEAVIISVARNKLREPVKLDVSGKLSKELKHFLSEKIGVSEDRIFTTLSGNSFEYINELGSLLDEKMPETLMRKDICPTNLCRDGIRYMDYVSDNDILTIIPFESPELSLALLREASQDENVLEIRITVTNSNIDVRIVEIFENALKNGKNIRILAEIKNGLFAEEIIPILLRLEAEGAEINYSGADRLLNFETLQILYKDEDDRYRAITYYLSAPHSFYNMRRINLSVASGRAGLAVNLAKYFDDIVSGNTLPSYGEFIIAGDSFESLIISLIEDERKKKSEGRIFLKVKNLSNVNICNHLLDASRDGVKVRIINSGANIILPASHDETDNIEIISIAALYEEEYKVYIFGSGSSEKLYISTADFDDLSLEKNHELAIRLEDNRSIRRVKQMLLWYFKDNTNCRKLDSRGNYKRFADASSRTDVYEMLSDEVALSAESSAHFLHK